MPADKGSMDQTDVSYWLLCFYPCNTVFVKQAVVVRTPMDNSSVPYLALQQQLGLGWST